MSNCNSKWKLSLSGFYLVNLQPRSRLGLNLASGLRVTSLIHNRGRAIESNKAMFYLLAFNSGTMLLDLDVYVHSFRLDTMAIDLLALFRLFPSASLLVAHLGLNPVRVS